MISITSIRAWSAFGVLLFAALMGVFVLTEVNWFQAFIIFSFALVCSLYSFSMMEHDDASR